MSLSCKSFENCGCIFSLIVILNIRVNISFALVLNRNKADFTKKLRLNEPVIKARL